MDRIVSGPGGFGGFSTASTLKITGRRQAQLAGGPVDCSVGLHWQITRHIGLATA